MINSFAKPIIPDNEEDRLQALGYYEIVDTLPEGFFNNLAHIIARSFETPIALVSLVDREQVFFKANVGMPGTTHVSRGVSLCSLAILDDEPTIFEDATKEPCLIANPLVAGEFGLRFYAGAPITTPDGFNIGTVCVVDKQPRSFSELEQELLVQFAKSAMEAIIDRKKNMVYAPVKS
jgi:GAF domain-containing protein